MFDPLIGNMLLSIGAGKRGPADVSGVLFDLVLEYRDYLTTLIPIYARTCVPRWGVGYAQLTVVSGSSFWSCVGCNELQLHTYGYPSVTSCILESSRLVVMRVGKGREGKGMRKGRGVEGQAGKQAGGKGGFFPITGPLLNNKLGV